MIKGRILDFEDHRHRNREGPGRDVSYESCLIAVAKSPVLELSIV